ncbi:hypothetical protein LSAT2_011351 [Lamellibrachia satsuma]|nr:hypothetical protein LSAT2_011351 [Lamellibrachia satsuma]
MKTLEQKSSGEAIADSPHADEKMFRRWYRRLCTHTLLASYSRTDSLRRSVIMTSRSDLLKISTGISTRSRSSCLMAVIVLANSNDWRVAVATSKCSWQK